MIKIKRIFYIFLSILCIGSISLFVSMLYKNKFEESTIKEEPKEDANLNDSEDDKVVITECDHELIYGQTNHDFYIGKYVDTTDNLTFELDVNKMISWLEYTGYTSFSWCPSGYAKKFFDYKIFEFHPVGIINAVSHTIFGLSIIIRTNSISIGFTSNDYSLISNEFVLVSNCDTSITPYGYLSAVKHDVIKFVASDIKPLTDSGTSGKFDRCAPYVIKFIFGMYEGNFNSNKFLNVNFTSVGEMVNSIDFVKITY